MNAPFLTELDPEIAVKGSIDPIGLLALWTRYGRQVVGNLSLVGSSARGYTTLLLGYHFARRVVEERQLDEARFIDLFLTFEQLVAYSRIAAAIDRNERPRRVLGLRRARSRLAKGKQVPIGGGRDAQILTNQRSYGLWALFSGPAEASGLLLRKAMRLTDAGEGFVRRTAYPRFEAAGIRDARAVLDILANRRWFEPRGRDQTLARALAEIHDDSFRPEEREFYLERFACGGDADPSGRQHQLWELIRDYNDRHDTWTERFDMGELEAIIAEAKARGCVDLVDRLWRIRRFDHVAGPATWLFGYLQWCGEDRSLDQLAGDVRAVWNNGLPHVDPDGLAEQLEPVAEIYGDDGVERFERLARDLHEGNWRDAIEVVLAQNQAVMALRHGGPWLVFEDGTLRVRYRQEGTELPTDPARHLLLPYFLTSVKAIGGQVLGKLRDVEDEA